jgi:uncharacterized repeat protein (TIGR01451 family)
MVYPLLNRCRRALKSASGNAGQAMAGLRVSLRATVRIAGSALVCFFLLVPGESSGQGHVFKPLYLSPPSQGLDRIDPVSIGSTNTFRTAPLAGSGFQTISVVGAAVASNAANTVSTHSFTYNSGTLGNNRILMVGISYRNENNQTVTTVSYGGQSMELVGTRSRATQFGSTTIHHTRVYLYRLVNPPVGNQTLTVNWSANLTFGAVVGAVTFDGVSPTTPTGVFAGNDGYSATPNVNVAGAPERLMFGVSSGRTAIDYSVTGGGTLLWSDQISPYDPTNVPPEAVAGTGGTITQMDVNGTNYYVHVFTNIGSTTFSPPAGVTNIEVLVVGGGGGGAGSSGNAGRGGGGAGGLIHRSAFVVSSGNYTVTVGAGGSGGASSGQSGFSGNNSVFGTLTAIGGGGGGNLNVNGASGGSGGGVGVNNLSHPGGTGLQPGSASGGFGNRGGTSGPYAVGAGGGGGGGAGGIGGAGASGTGGVGGPGRQYAQFSPLGGSPAGWFAGGGGSSAGTTPGAGGIGGGGSGGTDSVNPTSGAPNTGSGGGGSQSGSSGGSGGSGIVIVRYVAGGIGQTAGSGQSKPGGNSVNLSWSGTTAPWAVGGVSLIPMTLTNRTSFLQTEPLCSDLVITSGEPISVHAYVTLVSGVMPANPSVTAILSYGLTNSFTLSNPTYDSGSGVLTWTGNLGSEVVIPAGSSIALEVISGEAGAVFQIDYDSAARPSRIILPVTTYINIDSFAAYDAPYPGGNVVEDSVPGEMIYLRAVVSDPFGYDDITGLDIVIAPTGGTVSATSVATAGCTRTYEYAWDTTGLSGGYSLQALAFEGLEGDVTAEAEILFSFCSPLVGLPVFALGETSERCQTAGSVTYTATSSNAVSLSYSLDDDSLAAGNTIDPATGEVTYTAAWSGTSTISVSAAGCGGPRTSSHTVTILPAVETPVFAAGSNSRRCRATESLVYSATAAHATGMVYSLDAVSLAAGNTIHPDTGEVSFLNSWTGTSIITATATGCGGSAAAIHTVLSSELVAIDDSVVGNMGKLLSFNVLTNDLCDVDPDSIVVLIPPSFGTLQVGDNGNMLYLPAGQFFGADIFTYQVCSLSNPGDCDIADVYITILDTGDDPCFEATRAKTFYLPFPENATQVRKALISAASIDYLTNEVRTVISIAVPYPGTIITWDHWEDGYETDITVPGQSTTRVWGDGDPSNGTAPGFPDDIIPPGAIIVLDNTFAYNPRNQSQVVFDGRDKIYSTVDITISKVTGDAGSVGSTLIFDVQNIKGAIYDTSRFGEIFVLPFGEDITLGGTAAFKYTALFIRAIQDGTVVTLDLNGNGVPDVTSPTLNEGEVWFYDGTASTPGQDPADVNQANDLKAGTIVAANHPIGADLLFGGIDTYGTRNVALLPSSYYGNTYYSPVYSTAADAPVYAFFVNPLDASITIDWQAGTGATGTLVVAANGTGYLNLNQAAGYRFESRGGEIFTAMAVVDADGAGSAYDWAFTMIPENRLTPFAHVSWAPGSSDFSGNYNPVWVTAPEATTLYIKYDGNLASGSNISPCFTSYDVAVSVDALESYLIYDTSDNDQSGLAVYSCDGIPIFAVWGQRPFGGTPSATPAIDVGYEVQPKCFDRYVFANDDRELTEEGVPVVIDVLRNDASFLTSINPASLAAGLLQPTNGTMQVYTNGTITYTPNPGFLGIDSFDYWICALEFPEICDFARVTVSVADCLAAEDENAVIGRVYLEQLPDNGQYDDEMYLAGIRVNLYLDLDCNGVVDVGDPLAETLLTDLSGRYVFRRGANFYARDDFGWSPGNYNVNTGSATWDGPWGRSSSVDIQSLVDPVPDHPTNVALRITGPSRNATRSLTFSGATTAALQFDVRREGLNNQGESLFVRFNGQLIRVIDDGGLNGTDLFYQTETLAISEALVNPDGVNVISFETSGSTSTDDAFWIDNVTLSYFSACYIVAVDTSDVSDFYEPADLNQNLTSFSSFGNCSETLYLGVRAVIDAVDDAASVLINTPLLIDVLANDTGATDPASVSHAGLLAPTNGLIVIDGDGMILYSPNPGFEGLDTFEYRVCSLDDPGVCDVATVTIQVVCANVPGSNVIRGLVYDDVNLDGDLDIGEPGVSGFMVYLYEDLAGNGVVSPGDPLVSSQATGGDGTYQFLLPEVMATTHYVVSLGTPLPSGFDLLSSPVTYAMSFDGAGGGQCAIDFGLHVFRPGLVVAKTVTPEFYIGAGETLTYTFTVENTGNVALTSVVVEDARLSETYGPLVLAAGETVAFTADYEVVTADINALSISNRVTVIGEDPHGRPFGDDDFIITLFDPATISGLVWHDLDVNGFLSPGETGFPAVVVSLTGTDILATPVNRTVITGPDGLYVFEDISAGTYALNIVYPLYFASSADVLGTVYVQWSEPPPGAPRGSNINPQDGTLSDITLTGGERGINYNFGIYIPPTDLGVTKTVDEPNPTLGDLVTFSIVVTNAGPNDTVAVQVTDLLPVGLSPSSAFASQGSYSTATGIWTVGALNVDGSATLTLSATVDPGTGGLTLTNTAVITNFLRPDPEPGNNSDSAIVTVQAADIGVSKMVDEPLPLENGTVIFTIAVTNFGPNPATSLEILDLLPDGLTYVNATPSQGAYDDATGIWNLGTLGVDAVATLALTATVDPGTGGTVIENTASRLSADQEDPVPENNSDTADITVVGADLSIEKSVNRRTPNENDLITYTLILRNFGPVQAESITVLDQLPTGVTFSSYDTSQGTYNSGSGVWDVGTLDVGENAFLLLIATVDPDTVFSLITNRASITNSDIPDPIPDNNSDEVVIEVSGLRLTKTSTPEEPVMPGDTISYTIVLTNLTAANHMDVNILDEIPEGTTYVEDSLVVELTPSAGGPSSSAPGTGGTITQITENGTNYYVHTFTNLGATSFSPPMGVTNVDVLVVGGGGGGGTSRGFSNAGAAGGGAGGLVYVPNFAVSGPVDIVVGAGGAGGPGTGHAFGVNGANSEFDTLVALGGGGGAGGNAVGNAGGSGGGSRGTIGGAGEQPASPSGGSGHRGGNHGGSDTGAAATGGGGAGGTGQDISGTGGENGGAGGVGLAYSITGSTNYYAGGGGGGAAQSGPGNPGAGGLGGGGTGGRTDIAPSSGAPNTGGGGGGGNNDVNGAAGGSGIVVVRYPVGSIYGINEVFDTTSTFTAPPGVTSIVVEAWGGGGGPRNDGTERRGGGGGGAYARSTLTVIPGQTYNVIVGLGGAVVHPGTVGNAGGNSFFADGSTLLARGGAGGTNLGGSGGDAATSVGDIRFSGGAGGDRSGTTSGGGGGGGGSAFAHADGSAGQAGSGSTGGVGGDGEGPGGNGGNNGQTGQPGTIPGGGGGARGSNGGNGGAGADGRVIVHFQLPTENPGTPGNHPNVATGYTLYGSHALTVTFDVVVDSLVYLSEIVNIVSAESSLQQFPILEGVTNALRYADLSLGKVVDEEAPEGGTEITYTLLISNAGPYLATGILVSEPLADGLAYVSDVSTQGSYDSGTGIWTVGDLAIGATAGLDITVSVDLDRVGETITNTAVITALNQGDPDPDNNTASVAIDVRGADIAITKSVDAASPFAGTPIVFTITADNLGPNDAVDLVLLDLLPTGLSYLGSVTTTGTYNEGSGLWNIAELPVGSNATLTVTALVLAEAIDTVITNTASLQSVSPVDPNPANDADSVIITPIDGSELAITKISELPGGATNVVPGSVITYTVTVTNQSAEVHHNVFITDPTPTGTTYVANSAELTYPGTVENTVADAFNAQTYTGSTGSAPWTGPWVETGETNGPLAGRIQVASDAVRGEDYSLWLQGGDGIRFLHRVANLEQADSASLRFDHRRVNMQAGEAVAIEVSANGVLGPWTAVSVLPGPGTDIAYVPVSVDITDWISSNTAVRFSMSTPMAAASSIWFDDVVITYEGPGLVVEAGLDPPVMATGISLEPGATLTLTFEAEVDAAPTGTNIINTAFVASDRQIIPLSASASDSIEFADLGVAKSVSDTVPEVGTPFDYILTVSNVGPFSATGVLVQDVLHPQLQLLQVSASQGDYSSTSGVWTVGTLALNDTATLVLTVEADTDLALTAITNTVTIFRADQVDVVAENNSASATVRIAPLFRILDAFYNAEQGYAEIHHFRESNALYDLLYVDAPSFHDNLKGQWQLAQRSTEPFFTDAGGEGRLAPNQLPNHIVRFYRISAPGFWEQPPRRASADVAALNNVHLHPGQNWVRSWGVPFTNYLGAIMNHMLPSGGGLIDSAKIAWRQRGPTPIEVAKEIWLADGERKEWVYSIPEEMTDQLAEYDPLAVENGFTVDLPTNIPMVYWVMVYRVPTNEVIQVLPAGNTYSLISPFTPESLHPSQLNLIEAGFVGGGNPVFSDWMWKYDRASQKVPNVIWYRTTDQTWRFNSTGYPEVPTNYFSPNDAIVIQTRRATHDIIWTNRPWYNPPTRDMNP